MRFASLCSGIGGADLALEAHGHHAAWHAELDPAPASVHALHWPDLPNVGDITDIDWAACEPVDIISAGYPCQPFSSAGQRKGTEDERHLWPHVRDAIGALRPRYAFLENVGGHFSLGAAIVVHDLAQIGYMSAWGSLGSSAVGGCHRRERFWLLATDATNVGRERLGLTRDGWDGPPHGDRQSVDLLPTPTVADSRGSRNATSGRQEGSQHHSGSTLCDVAYATDFGRYQPAIDRWTGIFGPPPAPTDHKGRLNPQFSEWMLGYPAGWVTDAGLSRSAELRALGNAQQPQVATAALSILGRRIDAMTRQEVLAS